MGKKYMLPLLVPIRPEHRDEADGKLAVCLAGIESAEATARVAREEKKRLEGERKTINQRLSRKVWEEPVLCEERRSGGIIEVVRLDNHEVVRSFKADDGESQPSLAFNN
jgi:hypothetical protein